MKRLRYFYALIACFLLVACTDWPNVEGPEDSAVTRTWPELQPLSDLADASGEPIGEMPETEELQERAKDLRRRARILRRPVPDQEAFDALRAEIAS